MYMYCVFYSIVCLHGSGVALVTCNNNIYGADSIQYIDKVACCTCKLYRFSAFAVLDFGGVVF